MTKVNPVEALTSGIITKDDIGKTVYLSNSVAACQEWQIADINHDGTSGTVDLFPKYVLENTTMKFSNAGLNYSESVVRSWLNNDFYNGFTEEVKNAMKVQSFPSNGSTLNDKVKCPSLDEVGCHAGYYADYAITEGTIYPIFGTKQLNPNTLAVRKYINGGATKYWTRSRYTYYNCNYIWCVAANGTGCAFESEYRGEWLYTYYNYYYNSYAVVACIRF